MVGRSYQGDAFPGPKADQLEIVLNNFMVLAPASPALNISFRNGAPSHHKAFRRCQRWSNRGHLDTKSRPTHH